MSTEKRYKQLCRVLPMLFKLSKRGYTVRQLSKQFRVCTKTIRRDLSMLQTVGIPVYNELVYDDAADHDNGRQINAYRVDAHWANQFLKK